MIRFKTLDSYLCAHTLYLCATQAEWNSRSNRCWMIQKWFDLELPLFVCALSSLWVLAWLSSQVWLLFKFSIASMYCAQCCGGVRDTMRDFHTATAVARHQCAAFFHILSDPPQNTWQLFMDSHAVLVCHSGWMKFQAKSLLNDSAVIWPGISFGCVCSLVLFSVDLAQPLIFVFFQIWACINVLRSSNINSVHESVRPAISLI